MWSPWEETILDTMKVLEEIINDPEGVVGFNLAFDWFHICKFYTTLLLMSDWNMVLKDCLLEFVENEPKARLGPCCKPKSALDLMLFARKGPYQSTMARKDIIIRRVPNDLAWELAKELEERIKLKDIYFARRKDKTAQKWKVLDCKDKEGRIDPNFKNVVLKFSATSALKALAIDALGLNPDDTLVYQSVSLPKKLYPNEKKRGYAPFALAFGSPSDWNGTWPDYIRFHVDHWTYNPLAREYAKMDVVYLQKLHSHFGQPPLGDDDSILACMVGAVRWRGFAIDRVKLKALLVEAKKTAVAAPTTTKKVKWWVNELMTPEEVLVLKGSTKKTLLEDIANAKAGCPHCKEQGCPICEHTGKVVHPAAVRARACLDARKAKYRIDFIEKLLLAGRLHAAFDVIGTKSTRMSGKGGDLNSQGVDHTDEMRDCFSLADDGLILSIGDFKSFEVVLADAVYEDPNLRRDLQSGRSIHSEFALMLFPDQGLTYEMIEASKGSKIFDYRDYGKRGVFAIFYGGDENTLFVKLRIPLEIGKAAVENFVKKKYRRIGMVQDLTRAKFCSMQQPNGIGTQVVWHEPADYVESKTGFKRHFTLENQVCKALFNLGNKSPKHWKDIKIRVQRRKEGNAQFASGATQSALYGAAFGIQGQNMRAAVNHEIQSYGAVLTKKLQANVWAIQPCGIGRWKVVPMNIHDELIVPNSCPEVVHNVVDSFINETKEQVPLIAIDWKEKANTWMDKK